MPRDHKIEGITELEELSRSFAVGTEERAMGDLIASDQYAGLLKISTDGCDHLKLCLKDGTQGALSECA